MSAGRISKRVGIGVAGAGLASAMALGAGVGVGTAHAASAGTKVKLAHRGSYGKVLVTTAGRSLYDFSIDTHNKSHCGLTCRIYWKPLKTSGRPVAGTGVKARLLGQTANHQVTYNGKPLYTYVGDTRSGQTTGEGSPASGGYWYLVNAKGHSVH